MATKKEFTGAQLANQLIAMFDFLNALGYNTEDLTLDQAFEIKAGLIKGLKKSNILNKKQ